MMPNLTRRLKWYRLFECADDHDFRRARHGFFRKLKWHRLFECPDDDPGNTGTRELHLGSIKEGLKALNFNPLELQQSTGPLPTIIILGVVLW